MPRILVSAALGRMGLAFLRDLGRGGFAPVGGDFREPPRVLRSRWARSCHRLPPLSEPASLLERLRAFQVDAVLPLESQLVAVLSRHRDSLAGDLGLAIPALPALLAAYDNRRTALECLRLGIPAPRVLERHAVVGPFVVKPREDVGTARGVVFGADPAELGAALAVCGAWGEPFIQEYIPGGVEAMRTAVLLFDRRTRLVAHFTMRKLCQLPAAGGVTTMGVSTAEPELVRLVLPFFTAWRWQGPAEVELKVDPRDGRPKVIEINPRLPGYTPFAIACGLHLPRLYARVALGETPAATDYAVGRTYVDPLPHLRTRLVEAHGAAAWLSAVGRALRETVPALPSYGADLLDPLPFLGKLVLRWTGNGPLSALQPGARLADLDRSDDRHPAKSSTGDRPPASRPD